MIRLTLRLAVLLAVLVLGIGACSTDKTGTPKTSETGTDDPASEGVPFVEATEKSPYGPVGLDYVSSIGSDEDEDYLFSIIRGVAVDPDRNVVVFDGILKNIRVFSPDGLLLRRYDLPEGQGPGEFMRASTFGLSRDGTRLYLYDMITRRITILDHETFAYVHSFSLNETQHAVIQGGPDQTIVAVYNQLDLGDRPLVHVFDEQGNKVAAFEKRHEDYPQYLRQDLQIFHQVSLAQSESLWFLAFAYPYDVRVYNTQHELLRRFRRAPGFFGGSFRKNDFLFPTGTSSSLVVAGEQLLLHVLRDQKAEETWIHAFDFEGRLRGELDMRDERWGRRFFLFASAVDPQGFVYAATSHPYPRLLKFKIVTSPGTAQ